MTSLISLANVSVVRAENPILNDVSWQVSEGQRWVVMGPNGSGKTTLMQVCSGYIYPTTGVAQVLGYQIGRDNVSELRTQIGISSSAISAILPPNENVLDVVLTAAYGLTERWNEDYEKVDFDRANQMIETWGLAGMAKRTIGSLSEGERKRVLIARSLMNDPEILMLDEPAAGLDVAGREDLVSRLSALASDPLSPILILVTHHVEEIPPNFTHALLMSQGAISSIGSVHAVIKSEPMSQAFGVPLGVEFGEDRWYARGRLPSRGRRARN